MRHLIFASTVICFSIGMYLDQEIVASAYGAAGLVMVFIVSGDDNA